MTHDHCNCGCEHDHDEEGEPMIIETVTEEGEHLRFEVLNIFDYKGKTYAMLDSVDEDESDDDDEDDRGVFIMEFTEEGEGYTFTAVDDEDLLDEIMAYVNDNEDEEDDEWEDWEEVDEDEEDDDEYDDDFDNEEADDEADD